MDWTKPNESDTDRRIRMALGALMLVGGGVAVNFTWLGLLGLVGLVPLVTGAVGTCPIYTALGIHTGGNAA